MLRLFKLLMCWLMMAVFPLQGHSAVPHCACTVEVLASAGHRQDAAEDAAIRQLAAESCDVQTHARHTDADDWPGQASAVETPASSSTAVTTIGSEVAKTSLSHDHFSCGSGDCAGSHAGALAPGSGLPFMSAALVALLFFFPSSAHYRAIFLSGPERPPKRLSL